MYALIDDADQVAKTRSTPPTSLALKDGRTVSGTVTDPVRLKMAGWVEATEDKPVYDPDFERLVGPTWTVVTEEYLNSEMVEGTEFADGQTYTVPVSATASYTVEPRPPYLAQNVSSIAGDGVEVAVIEYRDTNPGAPTEVTFTVNGVEVGPVVLDNGSAGVVIDSTNPGDIIEVSCEALPNQTMVVQVKET